MPIKLIPLPNLRFLHNSSSTIARFTLMRPNSTLKPTRAIPILSRVFPHKLKFQALCSKNVVGFPNLKVGVRSFSSRGGSEVRAAKSLIDDEAELSDWVSELRSDSFKSRSYSEDDDNGGSSRGRGRGRGRGGYDRGGRGNWDSSNSSVKRRRGGDFDDNGGFNRDRGFRDSFDSSPSRNMRGRRDGDSDGNGGFNRERAKRGSFDSSPRSSSRGRGRFGSEFDREDEGFGSRRENGFQKFGESSRGRGSRGRGRFGGSEVAPKRGGSNKYGESRGGRGTWGSMDSFSQNSRGKGRFGDEMKGENDGFMSRRKDNTFQGGGRGGRQRRGGNSSGRLSLMASDEDLEDIDEDVEGEEKLMDTFRELISDEEDSDVGVDEDEDEDENNIVDIALEKGNTLSGLDPDDSAPVSPRNSSGGSDSYLSETRFDQCSVSALSLKAIKDAGYEKMTVVQEATLPVILKGKDVLAKAKTGTGKTVAFLLPSIEVVAKLTPPGRDQKRPPIVVLVICPTRELASQAAAEANKLVKYHSTIGVQVVIGGTRLALEQKRMQANPCQILVATPGRLKDHIENTSGFATRLMGVKVLVLDEADHLLDMGFRKDIERIIAAVPKQRQTLLFSATVPSEVRQICHIALKRDHEFINTVEEGSEETHAQVRQTHLVAPLDNQFPLLYTLLKDHIADDVDYKVLVFCTTAMVTRLVADLLGELKLNVREIHSRKPQSYRTRVSDEFRKSKGLILVTSDVSARGVDYPDVTLVIQVGLPADKEQYIHRLGRTGRKGKEGQGVLLLAPWEEFFLSTIRDLPISKATPPLVDPDTKKKVEKALSHVEMKNKEAAYQAWLGYYNSNKTVGKDKYRLVELANEFSRCMGLDNPPAIPKLVLGKMGLRNVPGLRSK